MVEEEKQAVFAEREGDTAEVLPWAQITFDQAQGVPQDLFR